LSSLLVVGVLGSGLWKAGRAHQELEHQFERLVQHDLKLADDAEVMLRLMADLETGKRGYLLTGDRTFLQPYDDAIDDVESVLKQAADTAENGMEDERVAPPPARWSSRSSSRSAAASGSRATSPTPPRSSRRRSTPPDACSPWARSRPGRTSSAPSALASSA
jgi:hypothetical protein